MELGLMMFAKFLCRVLNDKTYIINDGVNSLDYLHRHIKSVAYILTKDTS